MGICRLYYLVAEFGQLQPEQLIVNPRGDKEVVDRILAREPIFSYIGARLALEEFVLECARDIVPAEPPLDTVADWYTKKWRTNSGSFPDFVVCAEAPSDLRGGVFVECKSTAGKTISSFNSTMPSRSKSLEEVARGVAKSVRWFEERRGQPSPVERRCFYAIRTFAGDPVECRLSIVDGAFFETIPHDQLLEQAFRELLVGEASVEPCTAHAVAKLLARVDRKDIARTRHIPNASIKPRFRVMSEVHSEGNPHEYEAICPRSVNLVLKIEPEPASVADAARSVALEFQGDGMHAKPHGHGVVVDAMEFEVKLIDHKRNGRFVVVQTTF